MLNLQITIPLQQSPKLFRKQIPEEKCGLQFVLHMMCAELGRSAWLCLLTLASDEAASQAYTSSQFLSLLHRFGALLFSAFLFYSLRLVLLTPDVWGLDNQPKSFLRKWWVFRNVRCHKSGFRTEVNKISSAEVWHPSSLVFSSAISTLRACLTAKVTLCALNMSVVWVNF